MRSSNLFKAKRTDNQEWIVGYLYRVSENHPPFIMLSDRYGESYEVDESTICRCVGIEDKNKKLIFENDICKYYNLEDKDGIALIKEDYVKWIGGSIRDREMMTPLFYLKCGEEWETIGNIFDHPKLLEKLDITKEQEMER